MYMNRYSVENINNDQVISEFRRNSVDALSKLVKENDMIRLLYEKSYPIYSIEDNKGIKWHRNHYVTEDIRKRKLICAILEQYLSYIFISKFNGLVNSSSFMSFSMLIYRIENKLCVLKSKIHKQ